MGMSLVEDLVYLLRYVLEYFGVPAEMLVPGWNSTQCGQYRSIVRMIGTNLPLAPHPRVHFQIPLQAFRRQGHIDVSVDTPDIPSLADVLWLAEDKGDSSTKFRSAVPARKCGWPQGFEISIYRPTSEHPTGERPKGRSTQPEALQKISALEEELQKLRAQIAMIVAAPSADGSLLPSYPSTPCSTPLPAATLTSTPLSAPPPPPPPPLPPPAPAVVNSAQSSVKDIIRQRQAARKTEAGTPQQAAKGTAASTVPSMMEVLKNMNKVKLRTVERSPGGTPVKMRRRSKGMSGSDPAALIAEALKKKFSRLQRDDSFDKENRSAESSPFSSPDTPRVLLLTRRSQVRVHL